MDCREAQGLLLEFLEDALSARQKQELEEHCASCVNCRKERELLVQSWQMLDSYQAPRVPENFTESLMRRIHSEQAEYVQVRFERRWPGFLRPVPVLAVILPIVIAVSLFLRKPQVATIARTPAANNGQYAKVEAPVVQPSQSEQVALVDKDKEIVQNLDVLQNAELLQNMNVAKDLDTIEKLDAGNS